MLRAALFMVLSMMIGYGAGVLRVMTPEVAHNPDAGSISLLGYRTAVRPERIRRTAILNTLAERYKYKSYLEIGQGNRSDNYDFVNCLIRVGVDPDPEVKASYGMTSDEFFAINNDYYDLIFIDGLHTAEQTFRDIINSLDILNENGSIVVHDCNPKNEKMQIVPRAQSVWTGDVWKAWVRLRNSRNDLEMYVVDVDYGCGVIRKGNQQTPDGHPKSPTCGHLKIPHLADQKSQ